MSRSANTFQHVRHGYRKDVGKEYSRHTPIKSVEVVMSKCVIVYTDQFELHYFKDDAYIWLKLLPGNDMSPHSITGDLRVLWRYFHLDKASGWYYSHRQTDSNPKVRYGSTAQRSDSYLNNLVTRLVFSNKPKTHEGINLTYRSTRSERADPNPPPFDIVYR